MSIKKRLRDLPIGTEIKSIGLDMYCKKVWVCSKITRIIPEQERVVLTDNNGIGVLVNWNDTDFKKLYTPAKC